MPKINFRASQATTARIAKPMMLRNMIPSVVSGAFAAYA